MDYCHRCLRWRVIVLSYYCQECYEAFLNGSDKPSAGRNTASGRDTRDHR
jgi:hypothetical protein